MEYGVGRDFPIPRYVSMVDEYGGYGGYDESDSEYGYPAKRCSVVGTFIGYAPGYSFGTGSPHEEPEQEKLPGLSVNKRTTL